MYSNWFSKNNHRFNKSPNKIINEITWVYGDKVKKLWMHLQEKLPWRITLTSKRILLLIIELYNWDILISLISSRYLYTWHYLLQTVWILLKNACYSLKCSGKLFNGQKNVGKYDLLSTNWRKKIMELII